jgi:hypothetical protein
MCGSGCSYCTWGNTRHRWADHATRTAAKQALRVGRWRDDYMDTETTEASPFDDEWDLGTACDLDNLEVCESCQ